MGYCMHMRYVEGFEIPFEKFAEARQAIVDLMGKANSLGRGGYNGHKNFSWVSTDRVLSANCLPDALLAWRWTTVLGDHGIEEIGFSGEKLGEDKLLFDALAPFVKDGAYIEMVGEDGGKWRWIFTDGKCKEVYAKEVWEEEE